MGDHYYIPDSLENDPHDPDLTGEWDNRAKVTGVTSSCCGRECARGGTSGRLFCPQCGTSCDDQGRGQGRKLL